MEKRARSTVYILELDSVMPSAVVMLDRNPETPTPTIQCDTSAVVMLDRNPESPTPTIQCDTSAVVMLDRNPETLTATQQCDNGCPNTVV